MAFYQSDPIMNNQLKELLDRLTIEGRPELPNSIAITWIRYDRSNPEPGSGIGAGWSENRQLYPASVVKIIYAIATEAWIQKDLLPNTLELRSALQAMLQDSSNDATSLIIDLLSGTTSGPSLFGNRWEAWKEQRLIINKWLNSLNWPELKNINCCQKTWGESPYGREKDFYGEGNINRNSLSTAATARIMENIMTGNLVSPQASKRIKNLLSRSLDIIHRKADSENQIDGFLGEGLAKGSRIWSKAGYMSQARHDAAWFCEKEDKPMLLVVFTQGRKLANDRDLLPVISKELCKMHKEST